MTVTVDNDSLSLMLKRAKRPQVIDGKSQDQVHSCVLHIDARKYPAVDSVPRLRTVNLSKDGVSSISSFSCNVNNFSTGSEGIFIPDINNLLGVLKYHGKTVSLTPKLDEGKLTVKSSKKQTTLIANRNAASYPSNPLSLEEWSLQAKAVDKRIVKSEGHWLYHTNSGTTYDAQGYIALDSTDLYEALRCDSMNGQKINKYRFYTTKTSLLVETGGEMKGQTQTILTDVDDSRRDKVILPSMRFQGAELDVTVQGGLEQLLANISGDMRLMWFDFTNAGQGVKLLFEFGNEDYVLQSGMIV